jgi:hypothetical protein
MLSDCNEFCSRSFLERADHFFGEACSSSNEVLVLEFSC